MALITPYRKLSPSTDGPQIQYFTIHSLSPAKHSDKENHYLRESKRPSWLKGMTNSSGNDQSTSLHSIEEGRDPPQKPISASSSLVRVSLLDHADPTAAIARSRLEMLSMSSFYVSQADLSSEPINSRNTATVMGTSCPSSPTQSSSTEHHLGSRSAKADPAMTAALFHGRCEAAAWRIQESFRGRRNRLLGMNTEDDTPPGEGNDSKGHENGDAAGEPDPSGEEPDKPNSPEVDRSHIYLAAFIALFSCTIFILRQIRKLFGNEDDSDLAQEVGNQVVEETAGQAIGANGANAASGGTGGGAPGGNPP